MQCGSNLSATFLAFDVGGGLVCVPRSGAGASGGVGAVEGWSRDELSCGDAVVPDCARIAEASKRPNRKMARVRGIRTTSIVPRGDTRTDSDDWNGTRPPPRCCRIRCLGEKSA